MLSNFRLDFKSCVIVFLLLALAIFSLHQKRVQSFGIKCPSQKVQVSSQPEPKSGRLEQQRRLYEKQKTERQRLLNSASHMAHVSNGYIPEVNCPYLARLGAPDDGGKWVCNPWALPQKCVIYSLGVGNDVSFEVDINSVTEGRCTIYSFDDFAKLERLFKDFTNIFFKPWLIGLETDEANNKYRVSDIMKKLDHKHVDILKMDIENWEHKVIPDLFREDVRPCQILVEVHGGKAREVVTLLKVLSNHDYLNFAKEHNGYHTELIEYCFIHQSCLQQYEVPEPILRNFS